MTDDRETHDEMHDPDGHAADARLVALLHDARRHYHVPAAPPPVDAMWAAIEAAHFGPADATAVPAQPAAMAALARPALTVATVRRGTLPHWGGPAMGLAAGLLLGVGIGAALWRGADATRSAGAVAAEAPDARSGQAARFASAGDPAYDAVATEYFDEAVALLAALPARLEDDRPDARLAAQARDLLSTTRLLLDSPAAGHDAELQALLDDLELVLAQVVRLPAERDSSQAALINEALHVRDVLPRLRTAAAQASAPLKSFGADD